MRNVCLITTGGTIASKLEPASGHVTASVTGAELRAGLHDPLDGITVTIEEFCNVGSYAIDLPLGFALARRIGEVLQDPACDGVVVTHGTDTMEESAYMADLLVQSDKPIVFTGAQYAADEPNPDGPRNIANAIRLAASQNASGLGAVVCFEQEFHAARDVTKSHTSRVDTFISAEHGKLGEVDGDRIIVHRRPVLRRNYRAEAVEQGVELIKLVMGSSDRFIRFAAENGARAIVIEGFGRGNATPAVTAAAIDAVKSGIPVVMTSRCQRGRVKPIYGSGGGKSLAEGGVIFAGDLSGPKARVLVSVLLGMGLDTDRLRKEIEYLGG
ncbi:asparaginase [Chelatococcus sp. GCM10030263]|uniref:asparaginase n=1 Tax=Chelatococcus sp. GCM10030263 TaxID=3273387 RepID=UPI00360B82D1